MDFREWLSEATVQTKDIGEAIKKTLEFKIPGKWKFEIAPHKWYDITTHISKWNTNAVRISANLKNEKTPEPTQYFFLSAYAILLKDLISYDSINGDTNMRINASLHFVERPGIVRKLDERQSLKTPYELAKWVEALIEKFGRDEEPPDDSPEDAPSPFIPQMVGA
jgi:hypothetical protein